MPSYKTLYTKSQARVEKLTDLVISAAEKQGVLINEIGLLRTTNNHLIDKVSELTTKLTDLQQKVLGAAITTKPAAAKATGTKPA